MRSYVVCDPSILVAFITPVELSAKHFHKLNCRVTATHSPGWVNFQLLLTKQTSDFTAITPLRFNKQPFRLKLHSIIAQVITALVFLISLFWTCYLKYKQFSSRYTLFVNAVYWLIWDLLWWNPSKSLYPESCTHQGRLSVYKFSLLMFLHPS